MAFQVDCENAGIASGFGFRSFAVRCVNAFATIFLSARPPRQQTDAAEFEINCQQRIFNTTIFRRNHSTSFLLWELVPLWRNISDNLM